MNLTPTDLRIAAAIALLATLIVGLLLWQLVIR